MSTHVSYHQVALTRGRELRMRMGFALLIAVAAGYGASPTGPAIWLASVIMAQLLNVAVGVEAARDPDFTPSWAWQVRYLAVQFLTSAVFAAIAPLMWFHGGMEGRLIALVVLMGALLNFGTQPETSGRLLWCGCLPYIVTLGALPLVTAWLEPQTSAVKMVFLDVGAGLYLLHVMRAVRGRDEAGRATAEALEHARRASEAKSTFLATMSHEIRTPLNGVLGMAQAMEADSLSEVQRKRLEVIRQSGGVLLTLLNDLLDISKIEAAKLELEDGRLDVGQMAEQAGAAFAALAADKDITLSVTAAPSALGVWRADPTRVRQILYNLLSNAVKFTERGSVGAQLDVDEDGRLRMRVRDTGVGISAENLAGLFQRFVQGDASTTRRFGGTGLGLAISRELARLMGGDLTVESEPGEGTVFTAVLPLTRAAPAPAEATNSEGLPAGALRVLVAEDNVTNRLVIATLLEQVEVAVDLTENGEEAFRAWRHAAYDLVLMDIQMPVMDGLEAMRRIRALEASERRPRTPVVALTANAMSHHLAEYQAAGFDGVATKPIQLAALLETMNQALTAVEMQAETGRSGALAVS